MVASLQSLWVSSLFVKLSFHVFLRLFHCMYSMFPTLLQVFHEFFYLWYPCLNHKVSFPRVSSKIQFEWCFSSCHMFLVIVWKFRCGQPVCPIVLLVVHIMSQEYSYFLVYPFCLSICLRVVCCEQFPFGSQYFSEFFHEFRHELWSLITKNCPWYSI